MSEFIIVSNFGRWYAETEHGELCFDHEPKQEEIDKRMEELAALELAMQESALLLEAEDGTIV